MAAKIVVVNNLTLDGVTQAPGRADEDTRDGFQHGGWAVPYSDDAMGRLMARNMGGGALLFGRRTYEDFYGFWPHQTDNPFTPVLDSMPKYVASRTLAEPLPWQNSILLEGDVPTAVAALKDELGGSLVVLGSGNLVATLMEHGLVDEYNLLIHPLVLGSGRRLFASDGVFAALELVNSVTTSTGVLIGTYLPKRAQA